MKTCVKIFGILALLLWLAGVIGCQAGVARKPGSPAEAGELGVTIGSLAEIFASDSVSVRGYGLVGGLNGTGSAQCPASVRSYLEKYIRAQLAGTAIGVEELIASPDTAVVAVEGQLPAAASRNQRFDLMVSALPGTSTTSLEGGWLYGADLYDARRFGGAFKPLATAEGQVFIDHIDSPAVDERSGYLLNAGMVTDDYPINLALRTPDFRTASQIRNRINERFTGDTAWAVSPAQIELRVPANYENRKADFIRVVKAMYLVENQELVEKRILTFIQQLAASSDKAAAETGLEAIGNRCVERLAALLNSSNEQVRLRAGRCMLNLGDQRGLEVLWKIAADNHSAYRLEAIEAIVLAGNTKAALAMLRGLLRDDDFRVRLAAYENLREVRDVSIATARIRNSFYVDQIAQSGSPSIYVTRSGESRIALFGSPIYCKDNIFIQSQDGTVTINAPPGQGFVSILRRHPKRPDVIAQLKSSFDLADIITVLGEEPQPPSAQKRSGVGVPYSTIVALLKQMVDEGAVEGEFRAGPLPGIGANVKK